MGTLDRTVMKLTSLFSKLDEKILPNLIDGEQRLRCPAHNAIALHAPSAIAPRQASAFGCSASRYA